MTQSNLGIGMRLRAAGSLEWTRSVRRGALRWIAALAFFACGNSEPIEALAVNAAVGRAAQALKLDPSFDDPNDPVDEALPAADYTLFEADPVRPVAVLEVSGLVAVANDVDDYLELVRIGESGALETCGGTRVGLRPVAVAVVREGNGGGRQHEAELWVVNHVSDSVSVVHVDTARCDASVVDTLYVGDEPRDIVVAQRTDGGHSVFVAAAHRGQHHPVESARSGRDLATAAGQKAHGGLGDVFVFDAKERRLLGVVNLFTDAARALAVGGGVVYAAGFHTGNRTTAVIAEAVLARGLASLEPLLLVEQGQFVQRGSELLLDPGASAGARLEGGMPAVVGRGRCMPDPRDDHADRSLAQVCVSTDADNHPLRVLVQEAGRVDPDCQCTSGDGTLQPTTSVVVRFYTSRAECGVDYASFPDGTSGCWLDAAPSGVDTPAAHRDRQPAPMAWNDQVRFSLPDRDVFAIGVDTLAIQRSLSGVGTIIYGLAVQPGSERVFAVNTEAENLTRFEGAGAAASSTVQGHLHESRITRIDGTQVTPIHLNDHIDYGRCCERDATENERSLALPTSAAFSSDGQYLYFTALGSDKVGIVRASRLRQPFANAEARSRGWLEDVTIGRSAREPAGPVGLAVDRRRGTLYVKTHFTNELVAIEPERGEVTARLAFNSPEPPSITRGRPILYDARTTSSHGDSSCATCHVFGNFDGLAWDLGDPDGASVKNPGPIAQAPAIFGVAGLSSDPFRTSVIGRVVDEDFRSNKGPMSTQTLRGMANHGAQHWRGDRTRRFQDLAGAQPNFGSLDEDNSFNEFDVAIVGLNGNDRPLPAATFQDFTNFALQLTLPPNPVRALDGSLTPAQARARASYFGCSSMSDEQFQARECVALDGALVDIEPETRACTCARNPLLASLRDLPRAMGQLSELSPSFSDAGHRRTLVEAASVVEGLSDERQSALARIGAELDAALDAVGSADLQPSERGLVGAGTGVAVARVQASREALRAFSSDLNLEARLLEAMLVALLETSASPFAVSVAGLAAGLDLAFEVTRANAAVLSDIAAEGTGAYRDVLSGCEVNEPAACRLRIFDTLTTCNGCHTLDPRGNAELDVYRPGFFGTNGQYSFENESQLFKVPHLRNAYAKAGMFGMTSAFLLVRSSVLGDRSGGFFASVPGYFSEQVRGFGFLHDGSVDTVHHFLGTTPFAARPTGSLSPRDPGTAGAFQVFLPPAEDISTCASELRQVSDAAFAQLPVALQPALALCRASSPVPDVCLIEPEQPACQGALAAIGEALGDPTFGATFLSVRPLCFQMGSLLQGGVSTGSCFPAGLRDRAEMEDFIFAFDSNLKPMVGQQVTLQGRERPALLDAMLGAAQRGDCDLALRQRQRGYLVTRPDPVSPEQSVLLDARGRAQRLGELQAGDEPLTLTCYPPQAEQAEARRSAFSR